jgi:ABC-type branched-subunit amino acid transport system permease subunit
VLFGGALVLALYGVGLGLEAGVIEYVQRIILLAGINVILAVGLNLINGTTGQFSIGHAGFMAVGAYGCAYFGTALRPHVSALFGAGSVADAITFNVALLIGAALAGITGFAVGVPSLRLKGDYLAVVTLGFGEIIRILFNNARFLGAATGYFGDDPSGLQGLLAWCDPAGLLVPAMQEYGQRSQRCREQNDRNGILVNGRLQQETRAYGPGSEASGGYARQFATRP